MWSGLILAAGSSTYEVSVRTPKGLVLAQRKTTETSGSGPSGAWQARAAGTAEAWTLRFSCDLSVGSFEAAQYGAHYDLMEEAVRSVEREVRFQKAAKGE